MGSIDRIGVLCLAVALAVGLAPAATAAKKSKKSRVTTHAIVQSVGPDGVTGRVLGNRAACRAQREVTLFRVNSGPSVPSGEFVAVTCDPRRRLLDGPGTGLSGRVLRGRRREERQARGLLGGDEQLPALGLTAPGPPLGWGPCAETSDYSTISIRPRARRRSTTRRCSSCAR